MPNSGSMPRIGARAKGGRSIAARRGWGCPGCLAGSHHRYTSRSARHEGVVMADAEPPVGSSAESDSGGSERARPVITRRDFIAGAGIGVAGTAIVAGGVALATRPQTAPVAQTVQTAPGGPAVAVPPAAAPPAQVQVQPQAAQPPAAAAQTQLPRTMRRV